MLGTSTGSGGQSHGRRQSKSVSHSALNEKPTSVSTGSKPAGGAAVPAHAARAAAAVVAARGGAVALRGAGRVGAADRPAAPRERRGEVPAAVVGRRRARVVPERGSGAPGAGRGPGDGGRRAPRPRKSR